MDIGQIASTLRRKGVTKIDNRTLLGTYEIVDCDKFFTKGVNNRDNARWKRAQYIIVENCPSTTARNCLHGFMEFAETCQYIIFAGTDIVYNGCGKLVNMTEFMRNL